MYNELNTRKVEITVYFELFLITKLLICLSIYKLFQTLVIWIWNTKKSKSEIHGHPKIKPNLLTYWSITSNSEENARRLLVNRNRCSKIMMWSVIDKLIDLACTKIYYAMHWLEIHIHNSSTSKYIKGLCRQASAVFI